MILSENMIEYLEAIEAAAPKKISDIMNLEVNQLGNSLIDFYYSTSDLETRKLITQFMDEAGIEWMRKLITRDTSEVTNSKPDLATIYDFTSLVAANDTQLSNAG